MNQIIQSYLDAHIKEYEIESYDQSTAFEHFINKCIINRLSTERFDPIDVMTDDGEIGLDGVAILLNGQLVTDLASCHVIYENNRSVDVIVIHRKLQNRMDQIVDAFQGIGSKPLLQQFSVQQFDIAFMDFGERFFCYRFVLNIVLPEIAVVGFRRFFQIGLCFHIYLEEIV